ncbi:hypothetical protein [Bacillus wiedmannii]|nr:hypothetical protein [Bacillus wiedmannii]
MQIALPISISISVSAALPTAREKMTINSCGSLQEFYKDEGV